MKKLWVNTVPGKDPNADHIFHYHQELPKYIRGFHKCNKLDAIKLAALMARVRFDKDQMAVQSALRQNFKDYVPADLIRAQSSSDWRKTIFNEYNKKSDMTMEDAKTAFLETIYQWPTFGSTFFEVKQTSEPTYPEVVLIAINKNGVNIIHPQTKVCNACLFVCLFAKVSNVRCFYI